MKLDSLSDIGVRRRDNQDSYWCSRLLVDGREVGVACICDGMGGLDNGALASKMVIERIREHFLKSIDFASLEGVLKSVNKEILRLAEKSGGRSGTTCTVLLCCDGQYKIYHIGDTRCYMVSKSEVSLLTEDHSVVYRYKKMGIELPDDLKRKHRNSLTRCIGVEDNISLDLLEGTYDSGDIFVICSDGLWHYFDNYDTDISCLENLRSLVDNCINSGETDNITVVVLYV